MAPVRRPEGDPPPVYGASSAFFSLEINHGGFFMGEGKNRSYVDGHIIHYDQVECMNWSAQMLESIVEEIGYEMAGRMKIHYCIPMLTIANNGLREIKDEDSFKFMVTLVDIGQHFFSLYLDHDQSLRFKGWDDVVHFPLSTLPAVISPAKPTSTSQSEPPEPLQMVCPSNDVQDCDVSVHEDCVGGRVRQRKRVRSKSVMISSNAESEDVTGPEDSDAEGESSEDADSDFEIADSDFALSDGDDDLHAHNVDHLSEDESSLLASHKGKTTAVKKRRKRAAKGEGSGANDKGKQKCDIKEEISEGEDLWGPESEEDFVNIKFKTFREDDLHNPIFCNGQEFADVHLLRKAVRAYSCLHRKPIKLPINDKNRVKAVCDKNCSWYLWASKDNRSKSFQIKRYTGQHTCSSGKWKVHAFTAQFIADKYLESFRADSGMNMKNFSRVVQKGWKMTPHRSKLQRAKRIAMKVIYGDEEEQYKVLWDYAQEIRRSNPGSTFWLALDDSSRFKQCYMSLEACKRGFLQGCRPVIFIDGCHIKTRYRGQLLTAVGMDPNDCIFPIAMAAVEVEDTTSWTWFLETLKTDLGIDNTTPWTIMSDKQKGLINAVRGVFPDAEHRFCVRHMWQNFQQLFKGDVLKNQLWKIARSYTVAVFEKHMEEMKLLNASAHAWLESLDPKTWVRAFQSDLPKCDILLNNNCEVFNKYILEARELPVLSMLETIKSQLMTRHYTKNKERLTWTGPICPKIRKKLDKQIELSGNVYADGAGDGLFAVGQLVSAKPVDYVVDLKQKTCTCMRWQKSGIPCAHVVACLRHDDTDPLTLVDNCYSLEMHDKAYGNIVYPCKDRTEWEKMNGPLILPPLYTKHVGRPTKSRRKAPYEVDARGGGKKMSRHGVIMHCSYCGFPDHNKNGCKWWKAGLPPPSTSDQTVPPPVPEPVVTQEYNPDINPPHANTQDNMLVDNLIQQRPLERQVEAQPVPESTFITAAQVLLNQTAATTATSSTTIRQGDLAQKLLQLQQEKNRANEARKIALLEAKYQAEVKKAEEKARQKLEKEKTKALLAEAKAVHDAEKREKRRQDAELNKKAREETRKIITEVRKEVSEKKRKEAADKKRLAAESRKKGKAQPSHTCESSAPPQPSQGSQASNVVHLTNTETIPMSELVTEPVPKSGRMEWYLGIKPVEEGEEGPQGPV